MNELEYKFEVLEPESPEATVGMPQLLVLNEGIDSVKVIVYFMTNCALTITEEIAISAMGKVILQYKAHSPSNAYTACVNIRKVMFTFSNAQGMTTNFEFKGEKT